MKMRSWLGLGLVGLLVGCGNDGGDVPGQALDPTMLVDQVLPSVVRIYYGDGPGQGTGFIVDGEPGVCTAVTAAHVVRGHDLISIESDNTMGLGRPYSMRSMQVFPDNTDLALVTFQAAEGSCPYRSLPLGDSQQVKMLERLYVFGYPRRDGEDIQQKQVTGVEVSALPGFPDGLGYQIAYSGQSAGGMSGGPVVNGRGEVVAIHGKADLTEQGEAHFKWAVPVRFLHEKMAEVVASLPKIEEGSAEASKLVGDFFYITKRYEEALGAYEQAIQINPNFADAWNGKGAALGELQRYEDALGAYEQAIQIKPDYAYAWNNKGVSLGKLQKNEEALAAYEQAIQINPNFADAWNGKGAALDDLERYEEALVAYDTAIQINPNHAGAWYNKGILLQNLERYEEALTAYERAIKINPNYADSLNNKGALLNHLGKYEEALAAYDKAIQINPDHTDVWFNKGVLLNNLKRYDEALAAYDKAIQIKPDYADAWFNKGLLLANLSRHEEALASLDKAIQTHPNHVDAWALHGVLLALLNREQEAIKSVNKALALDPNNQLAQQIRNALQQ